MTGSNRRNRHSAVQAGLIPEPFVHYGQNRHDRPWAGQARLHQHGQKAYDPNHAQAPRLRPDHHSAQAIVPLIARSVPPRVNGLAASENNRPHDRQRPVFYVLAAEMRLNGWCGHGHAEMVYGWLGIDVPAHPENGHGLPAHDRHRPLGYDVRYLQSHCTCSLMCLGMITKTDGWQCHWRVSLPRFPDQCRRCRKKPQSSPKAFTRV